MLPLQITLDGFMSYRDAATLSFEGASLWMLAGNNGAGKSSVFDAMRWMLFNRHRGGAQGHEALIHHDKNRLRVAFDIEIASGRFRLLRTLSRGGKSSWQIEKLVDGATEKVPETDMRDGYNRWLEDHIGLSDETFGAAFYLAQGRGDAILSAKPEERYEMLAEIVDLSAFQRLHESARTRASELESQSRLQRAQFEAAPVVEASEIEAARENLARATASYLEIGSQIAPLSGLEPWSQQWQLWHDERLAVENSLQEARVLLRDAPQIEAAAARMSELEALLPPLENWLAQRERLSSNEIQIGILDEQWDALQTQQKSLALDLKAAQSRRDAAEDERQTHLKAQLEILTRQNEMAPQLAQAQALENGRAALADLEAQLAAFPAALGAEKTALETQIARAQSGQIALGVLRRFDRERASWRRATTQIEAASTRQSELKAAVPTLQTELEKRRFDLETARRVATETLETLAAAQARLADAESALQRFEAVRHEPNCHFCGQKLTPQHALREEKRLQNARENAKTAAEAAKNACDAAQSGQDAAQNLFHATQNELDELQNALQNAAVEAKIARDSQRAALDHAGEALRELSPDFAARFGAAAGELHIEIALHHEFPRAEDFAALQAQADALAQHETRLKKVEKQLGERGKIAARCDAAREQIEAGLNLFDEKSLSALREEAERLKTALNAASLALKRGEAPLQETHKAVKAAEKELQVLREHGEVLQPQLAALGAARDEITRALRQFEAENSALQPWFGRDELDLRGDFALWNEERARLESSDLRARLEALDVARTRVSHLETEAARLEKSLENVPAAARRAPESLRLEIEKLQREADELDGARREIELEVARLERLFETKKQLETELLDIETRARQHKTLADLLGPHQLQRFLLREAENGIVDEANAVLDRISSGSLRLELRADDDEVAGARKGQPKVLDVAVYQESGDGPSRPMLPAFLSGSQRFRVAVALALGIGRFATRGQGHSRLESVIIDEGFGSLDKVGRGEMIDELKALGEELKRVILVSHQEEFADAFSHRYLIEHDGVASTARLVVG
ncbi:MAG TPA: SMC family ATPase [Abditibacterium sp.]|jgi:DNA repair exonuclease SbcCD ATPase subunit